MADQNPFTSDQAAAPAAAAAPVKAAGGGYGSVTAGEGNTTAAPAANYAPVSAGSVSAGQGSDAYTRPDPEVDGPGANFRPAAAPGGAEDSKAAGSTAPAASASDYKLVNALFVILVFLSWVGCWVVFTGHLNKMYTGNTIIPSANCQMFWNRMECVSSDTSAAAFTITYGGCDTTNAPPNLDFTDVCGACYRSGQGSLALAVFGFLFLTPLLVLVVLRILNKTSAVPFVGSDSNRYHQLETVLTSLALFCFWVIVMLWRTKCMETAQSWSTNDGAYVVGSGWWYTVGTFFFLIVALVCSLAHTENPCCRHRCRDTLAEQPDVSAAARAGPDPSCLTGFQNSPAFATRCDSVLNVAVGVCLVLCWIGSLVAMGGELHRLSINVSPSHEVTFHWNSFAYADDPSTSYSDCQVSTGGGSSFYIISQDQCDSCLTGGRGTVATGALAFIAGTAQIVFLLLRMSGKVKASLLRFEHYASAAVALNLMFVSLVWGGTCFNSVKAGIPTHLPTSIMGTGWAYGIFCFILGLVNMFLLWIVRHRAADLPTLETGGVYANLRSEV